MAGVRDPAFWKRFSTAVHLEEETLARPDLKHSDSWLARQQRKKRKRTCICCTFWLLFFLFVAAVVGVIIWCVQNDIFGGGKPVDGQSTARMVRRLVEGTIQEARR